MKRDLRFYLTIFFTRVLILGMRLLGRSSTYFPGVFALKLCPNFLKQISKPPKIICVTGTNGKTTTCNMIADLLEGFNLNIVCNRQGSNMAEGLISTLLKEGTTFWGKSSKEIALFEVDERSSGRIYPAIEPDYIVVTNLFRDTIRREGNPDFIFDLLNENIPEAATLILNADDIISSSLGKNNKKVFYGIAPLKDEEEEITPLVKDACYDFESLKRYEYEFLRYHHIGIIKDFSPKCDYRIIAFDEALASITVNNRGEDETYTLVSKNKTDFYNQLAAISLLRELSFEVDKINSALSQIKIPKSRYEEEVIKGKKLIFMLSKGSNCVASARVAKFISTLEGSLSLIIVNDEVFDNGHYNSWYYEIDYSSLANNKTKQIIAGGKYPSQLELALLLQGIEGSKIKACLGYDKCAESVDISADNIVVVYDLDTMKYITPIRARLKERLEREV